MKFVLLIILLSIPAVWQTITPGYFPMHDDTQVVRVQQMYKALRPPTGGGQFPVRWVPDLGYGYGYPIFNFYNPLPYYFGAGLMLFGFDALGATKAMMGIAVLFAGISMFVLTRAVLKGSDLSARSDPSLPALLAATLYIYAPYHAVQIYVRGAVAEYWAYALLPLVFYSIWKKKIILAGISLAALITSHNLTAFMSIPFILMSPIFLLKKIAGTSEPRSRETMTHGRPPASAWSASDWRAGRPWEWRAYYWGFYVLILIFGFGLSAFFWMPAIFEANKTQVSQMVFGQFDPPAKHVITLRQLWSSPWGYGGSSPGLDDGLSLELGKVHLLGSFAAIVILLYCYIAKKTMKQCNPAERDPALQDNLTIFAILGLFFSLFFLLPFSAPIWNAFPVLAYIQFPWRFLTFASLFSSLLAAISIMHVTEFLHFKAGTSYKLQVTRSLLFVTYSLSLVAYSYKFFQPQFKYPTSAGEQTSREKIVWEVSKRSDEYLPIGFIRPKTLEEALRVDNPINQALVDELKKPTPVRRLGNIISAVTIMSMIGYTFLSCHSERRDV